MAIALEYAADYVNAKNDDPMIAVFFATAKSMVDDYVRPTCPDDLRDWAVLEITARLWERRNSPNGAAQFGPNGEVVRVAADVMHSVKPTLKKWRKLGAVG